MTKEIIAIFQRVTPWVSLVLTVGGASYSVFISGNIYGYIVTLAGVAVGAFDKHLSAERSRIDRAGREEVEARLAAVSARVADRTIPAGARSAFIHGLRDQPKGKVSMGVTMQDPETARFVGGVAGMLREAGYEVSRGVGFMMGGPSFGVAIELPGTLPDGHYSAPLIKALSELYPGLRVMRTDFPSDDVSVIVGGKHHT